MTPSVILSVALPSRSEGRAESKDPCPAAPRPHKERTGKPCSFAKTPLASQASLVSGHRFSGAENNLSRTAFRRWLFNSKAHRHLSLIFQHQKAWVGHPPLILPKRIRPSFWVEQHFSAAIRASTCAALAAEVRVPRSHSHPSQSARRIGLPLSRMSRRDQERRLGHPPDTVERAFRPAFILSVALPSRSERRAESKDPCPAAPRPHKERTGKPCSFAKTPLASQASLVSGHRFSGAENNLSRTAFRRWIFNSKGHRHPSLIFQTQKAWMGHPPPNVPMGPRRIKGWATRPPVYLVQCRHGASLLEPDGTFMGRDDKRLRHDYARVPRWNVSRDRNWMGCDRCCKVVPASRQRCSPTESSHA